MSVGNGHEVDDGRHLLSQGQRMCFTQPKGGLKSVTYSTERELGEPGEQQQQKDQKCIISSMFCGGHLYLDIAGMYSISTKL